VLVIVIDNSLPVSSTSTNDEHEHETFVANMTGRFNIDNVLLQLNQDVVPFHLDGIMGNGSGRVA